MININQISPRALSEILCNGFELEYIPGTTLLKSEELPEPIDLGIPRVKSIKVNDEKITIKVQEP